MSHESNEPADAFNNFIMNYINTKIQINFNGSFKLTHKNFTLRKVVNICIVYEIILWPYILGANFVIGISLFGAIKFAKNDDLINVNILAVVLDLMHVEDFHYQMVVGLAKML